jgi:putative two-component system response regulator
MRRVFYRKERNSLQALPLAFRSSNMNGGMGRQGIPARILVVDDDPTTREVLRRMLASEDHDVSVAADAAEARSLISWQKFDLLLCDVNMPGESGMSLGTHIAAEYPETATVMVTGNDDVHTAEQALAFGAYGYIVKPVRMTDLLVSVTNALLRLELSISSRTERDRLERELAERAVELRDTLELLEARAERRGLPEADTMFQLARAVEFRSKETGDHIARVGLASSVIAQNLGLPQPEYERIGLASAMHDVGKVAVPDHVLLKPGPLNAEERRQMERHAEIGAEVLQTANTALMNLAATIAWTHHERYDGTGYPRRLEAEEIPLGGRIVAVADVFDALTTDRVYRKALPRDKALSLMSAERGKQFDPAVLDCFLEYARVAAVA